MGRSFDGAAFLECLRGKQALSFLIDLAFNLTVAARGTYEGGTREVEHPHALRGLIEVSHRILSRASGMFDDSWQYTPQQFIDLILGLAEEYDSFDDVPVAIEMTTSRFSHRQ